jgi:peptidoglycan hydrolase-like protein with peptidoglycan-binding domain
MWRDLSRGLLFGLLAALLLAVFPGGTAAQEPEKAVTLIRGLDGGMYEPYSPALLSKVQEALRAEGLYSGETTGVLDEATMTALGEFQKQHDLQVSGVPSPETRKRLLAGASTDEPNS